ncbi:hypothetical protein [Microcoleus vaginatus]
MQQQECDSDDTCQRLGEQVRGDRENHTIKQLKNWEGLTGYGAIRLG